MKKPTITCLIHIEIISESFCTCNKFIGYIILKIKAILYIMHFWTV